MRMRFRGTRIRPTRFSASSMTRARIRYSMTYMIIEDEDFEDDVLEVMIVEEEVVQDEVRRPEERGPRECDLGGEVVNDE